MIADLLAQPEGRTLDFKREEVPMEKALRTLVAFANTAGGTLAIGVGDDREVIGVADLKMQEERYANAIYDGISPPLFPDLIPIRHGDRDVLLVRVPRQSGPFFVRREGEEAGTYVRVGSTTRRADERQRDELRRMAAALGFDERPCAGTTRADLDAPAIDAAFALTGRVPTPAILDTLGVIRRDGDAYVPSNGGVILFGTHLARARHFSDARFRAARFRGTRKADILDQYDGLSGVLTGIDDVFAFVQRNTRLAARIEGMRRVDVPEYGPLALRETLANAAAHTDYGQRGMTINVFVYDDRIDVESPGGWPHGYDAEDFRQGVSRQRNKVVSNVLRRLDLAEHLGTGFERIRSESDALGYPVPEWIEAGPILRVRLRPHPTFPMATTDTGRTDDGIDGGTDRGTDARDIGAQASSRLRKTWFLNRLGQGEPVSAESLTRTFGVSERTARRDIQDLISGGRIVFVGSPRTGQYALTDLFEG